MRFAKWFAVFGVACVVAALALKAAMLWLVVRHQSPVAFDSNYYLNIATSYFELHKVTPHMWRIPPENIIISGSGSGYGIYMLIGWLGLFGVTLAAGQWLMFGFGVLTLVVMFFVTRSFWSDGVAAIWAVAICAASLPFFVQFFIRMDAPAIFFDVVILWLHLTAMRRNDLKLHALVGALCVVAVEVHVLCALYALTYGIVLIGHARKNWRPLIAFGAGAAPFVIAYLVVHVLPDTRSYFLIAKQARLEGHFGPVQELARVLRFVPTAPLEAALLAVSAVAAWARGNERDRHYLWLMLGFAVAMMLLNPPVSFEYSAHVLPLLGLGAAGLLSQLDLSSFQTRRWALAVAAVVVMLFNVGSLVRTAMKNPVEVNANVEWVRAHLPRDTVLMGSPRYFNQLTEFTQYLSFTASWEAKVGAMVRDEPYEAFLAREKPTAVMGKLEDGYPEVRAYVEAHGFTRVFGDVWVDPGVQLIR